MKTISIPLHLSAQEAEDLAQFVKRVGFSEIRQNATNDDEAYRMRDAIDMLRTALAEVGFSPR